jgi:isopenicillin N synthase-like dioxygenase
LDLTDPEFPRRIVETFKKIGFAIITNHGLSPARIDEAFMRSKQFFMLDSKTKKAIVFNPNVNRGYMGAG